MSATRTRARVARLHRWLAVLLAPVIALVVLSGAVLAFRPIVRPDAGRDLTPRRVDVARLAAVVARAEAAGPVRFVGVPDGRTAVVVGPRGASAFDIATGRTAAIPPQPAPDVFDLALRVHKELWVGAGGLVTLASIALVFLVIAGPLLARPRRGGGALGRHVRAGWVLWPLVALLPLSLVMMKLHRPIGGRSSATGTSLARSLGDAARVADLTRLDGMQLLPDGSAFLVLDEASGPTRYVFADGRLRPMDSRVSALGRVLHEGTWAGRWSGMLNVLAAACMLWMLLSGLLSFVRRRRRSRAPGGTSSRPHRRATRRQPASPAGA